MSGTAQSVEEYLSSVPEDKRRALERLRGTIRSVLPEAEEVISYQIPMFKQDGKGVVSYAAFKNHCSLFVMSTAVAESFRDGLAGFEVAKGTVRFTPEKQLPSEVVKAIVVARREENEAAMASRKARERDRRASRKARVRG